MANMVCPWWLGYLLVSPVRRIWQDPKTILRPFVTDGMLVLEPGAGMGFFTLEIARLVGARGRVVVVDVQKKMLAALERRARGAGLAGRIEARLVDGANLGVDDLTGTVDFILAFAMIHELPDAARFLAAAHRALRPGCKLLVAEPRGHVKEGDFRRLMETAKRAGLLITEGPAIARSWTAVLARIQS